MSSAPRRRTKARSARPVLARTSASSPRLERTAIALVLIVLGSLAFVAELVVGAIGSASGGDAVVLLLLLALLPVVGVILLLTGDGGAQPAARPRRQEHHAASTSTPSPARVPAQTESGRHGPPSD